MTENSDILFKLPMTENSDILLTLPITKSQKSAGKEVEAAWACDDKRGALRRKEGNGTESTRKNE